MNTLAADARPANPAHVSNAFVAIAATLPAPTNDNTRCWTDDPRARLLLASMVAHPPHGEWKRTRYVQTQDEWFEYVGYRAEALDVIRMEHGDRAHAAYHAIGKAAEGAFTAWCHQPTATQAIDAVLEGC